MKEFILEHYKQNGYPLDKLILGGIRNNINNEYDMFNDLLYFIYDGVFRIAKGTTDPGRYYTKRPLNSGGAFHLNLGFHENIWRLRKHRGKYLALCDDSETENVDGWRDSNKNFVNDDNKIVTGNYGINWHYTDNDELINYASAGCQVTNEIKFFNESIECAIASEQDLFSYYLFDMSEVPTNIIVDVYKNMTR